MQLQGIRITYFIIGGIAVLWIFPLIWFFNDNLEVLMKAEISLIQELLLVFSIPFIYLIGMMISSIAKVVLNKPKRKIQKKIYMKYLRNEKLYQLPSLIKVASKDNEIYNRLEESLTAQLVARDTVLNIMLAIISFTFVLYSTGKYELLVIVLSKTVNSFWVYPVLYVE